MIVVVLTTLATGALLLWALYAEQVPPPRRLRIRRWVGPPSAADIRRRDFPLAVAGYDQDAVDAHLRALATAFAALRAEHTPADPPTSMPPPAPPTPPPGWSDAAGASLPPPAPAARPAPSAAPPLPPTPPPPGDPADRTAVAADDPSLGSTADD